MGHLRHILSATTLAMPILACSPNPPVIPTTSPTSSETTATYDALRSLPAPKRPVPVAVYSYPDLTGQFKAAETVSTNSRAVTQGAVWMLVKSLKDAAAGRWFKVIQRANLDNLLKERQIIRETRGRVEKQTGEEQPGLPSLLFAGVILEGGIIGYDSNTVTGGLGARYLGIGGDVQYRQDTVSVYLNAISSQTGEVLKSVMTRKTVVSYGVRGSVFKFVAFQKLLEGETGYTVNEPGQIALAQAIEHAVRSLIIEGALVGLWEFEDEEAGKGETQAYLEDKEDDLLIGDATSGVAQALLTDEQLQKIADVRKSRKNRLEAQAKKRQEHLIAKSKEQIEARKQLADAENGQSISPQQQSANKVDNKATKANDLPPPSRPKLVASLAGNEQKEAIVAAPVKEPATITAAADGRATSDDVATLTPAELAALIAKQNLKAKKQLAHEIEETKASAAEPSSTKTKGNQEAGEAAKLVNLESLERVIGEFEQETKMRLQDQAQVHIPSPRPEVHSVGQPGSSAKIGKSIIDSYRVPPLPAVKTPEPRDSLATAISAAKLRKADDDLKSRLNGESL